MRDVLIWNMDKYRGFIANIFAVLEHSGVVILEKSLGKEVKIIKYKQLEKQLELSDVFGSTDEVIVMRSLLMYFRWNPFKTGEFVDGLTRHIVNHGYKDYKKYKDVDFIKLLLTLKAVLNLRIKKEA